MELSVDDLRRRAVGGDATASCALGLALLKDKQAERDAVEGFSRIAEAARDGDGQAHALMAVFAAGGVNRAQSWDEALDHLRMSAEAGWAPARRELRFLGGGEGDDWRALRRQVDVEAWLSAPRPGIAVHSPRIGIVEGFLSPAACAWFIGRATGALQPAGVYREDVQGQRLAEERTNSEFPFDLFHADVTTCLLQARIEAAVGASAEHFETLTLMHYAPGEEFTPHHDFLQTDQPGMAENIRLQGQRVATFLVYLNDDYEGGETEFPRVNFSFKGKRGDALIFSNVDAAGAPDPNSLHAGRPPTRGEKWLLSQWIRNRPQGW